MSGFYLGVDAGTSKTVALVADDSGSVVGWGRAGTGDVYGAGTDQAAANVLLAVRSALVMADVEPDHVAAAAFRLAGVDWPEDAALWEQLLADAFPGLVTSVLNDGYAALRWGNIAGVGIAVLAGTGPAVAARGPLGEFVGGWWIQQSLGGHGIGAAAFRAVVEADLGVGPTTSLTEALLGQTGAANVEQLLWTYTRREKPRGVPNHKDAARLVLRAAAAGDAVARRIVSDQATGFARYAAVAAARTGWSTDDAVPLVLGGSLITSEIPVLRDAVVAEIALRLPSAELFLVSQSPAAGALLDAFAEAGALTEGIRSRVREAVLPSDLFIT